MALYNSPLTLPGDDLDRPPTTEATNTPDGSLAPCTDIHMTTSPTADRRLPAPSHDGGIPQVENRQNEPQLNNENQQINVQISGPRTFTTFKPYEGPRRNRNRRPAIHRAAAENFPLLNTQQQTNFPKYFTVTSDSGVKLSEINVIKANKEIEGILGGPPKCITETRAGHLIIEIKNESQSKNISKLKKLDKTPVTVEPHKTLNTIKGTIYYRNHPNYSTQELLDELKKYNVSEIYQTKRRINGTLMDQPIFIVTFNLCNLPPDVKIGWTKCSVRQYIPRPRRCTKCQMFGHGVNTCRDESGTCYNCGEDVHELPCNRQPKCPNCEEQHPASSPSCFYYKLEQESLAIQYKERIPYPEAKRIVKNRFIREKTTYSDAIKQQKAPTNESKDTASTKPTPKPPKPSVSQTQASANNHRIRLTTGRVTLQPAEQPPSRPATLSASNRHPAPQNEETRPAPSDEQFSNITASPNKETNNPRKNVHKQPLVTIESWEESSAEHQEPTRRDKKRSWTSNARALSAETTERAAKRYPPQAQQFTFKKFPMPSNMPNALPPPTKPPEEEAEHKQKQTTQTTRIKHTEQYQEDQR